MDTSNPSFGFGQKVTGGGTTTPDTPETLATPVSDAATLATKLKGLGTSTSLTVLELDEGFYDFRKRTAQQFSISAKNLTIRAKADKRVVLINFELGLALGSADNILIQDLLFISDGTGPEDAIFLDGGNGSATATSNVRITHCAFQGYFDIAIDSHSYRSKLLATIDHCLFFDSQPGEPKAPLTKKENFFPFANRGAINISSYIDERTKQRKQGNSFVTVAFNVFVDVWRRCPRVGFPGNFGHVYNNLVYRWGVGNKDIPAINGADTWNGMEVGNEGAALIQANRFIPWADKLGRAIQTDDPTHVIGTAPFPNEFDNSAEALSGGTVATATEVTKLYTDLKLTEPTVQATGVVDWSDIGKQAGPRLSQPDTQSPEEISRQAVLGVLSTAEPVDDKRQSG